MPKLRKAWPGVVEAVELIGSKQIQGRATMAGNLCNASPAADSVPAHGRGRRDGRRSPGPKGKRTVAGRRDADRARQDLAREGRDRRIGLPAARARRESGDAYLRFIPRTEMDIAVVGAGVSLTLDGTGVCTAARVSLGAVAPTVLLVAGGGAALIGTQDRREGAGAAGRAACSAACRPIDDKRGTKEYRIKVAGVLARRAAEDRAASARGGK